MRSAGFRAALIAIIAVAAASVSSFARADSGTIRISVLKGGWFLGASGGSGTLFFHGRRYPLSIGGLDLGLVFGASHTYLSGRVSNIFSPSDVAGVYAQAHREGHGDLLEATAIQRALQVPGRPEGTELFVNVSAAA